MPDTRDTRAHDIRNLPAGRPPSPITDHIRSTTNNAPLLMYCSAPRPPCRAAYAMAKEFDINMSHGFKLDLAAKEWKAW